jgi:hypothetical protein
MQNSNQSRKISLTLGLILTLFSAPAFGASFNFQSIADTNPSAGTGESAWISTSAPGAFTWTDDGITVTATARNLANTQEFYVYMDSDNAGMGVCQGLNNGATTGPKTGGTNLCSPSSDDNITYDEVLKLEFSEKVTSDLLKIVNGSHGTNFVGNFGVLVDATAAPTMVSDFDTTNALSNMFVNPGFLTGTTFHFISGATVAGSSNFNNLNQMYIFAVSAHAVSTPKPATLALFGSGLLILGGMRRASTRRSSGEPHRQ